MIRYLLFLLLGIGFSGCVSQSYEVQSVCEVTELFNYVVKWEIRPLVEGEVVIYSSHNPDKFDMTHPVAKESISKGRADIVINGTLNRRYFLLCFPNDVQTVVGVRGQNMTSVQNFRDMGGYENIDHRTVKWGKLYRSGQLDSIIDVDVKRVERMNVKSLVDLRNPRFDQIGKTALKLKNYYWMPIQSYMPDPRPQIFSYKFKRGDAILFMQDIYQDMIISNKDNLREVFKLLQEEDNYPLVVACKYGNMQTSLVMALLLAAIEVPEQVIFDDYLLSNKYFDMRSISAIAANLPFESQDAITTMMTSEERYLNSAFQRIQREYGSVNAYLEQELGVDEAARNRLKEILLD